MRDLLTTIGSMITSFLGPYKNLKFIIDDKEIHIVRCPQHLLDKTVFMDSVSYLVENTIQSHHNQFGCSSTSLLAMWYFWHKEFQSVLLEGCNVSDVIKHSQNIFDGVINLLPQMTIDMKQLLFHVHKIEERASKQKNSSCNKCFKTSDTKPDNIPTGICYSSRYFSPFSVQSELFNDANNTLETLKLSEAFRRNISTIVRKLSHDDLEWSEIVSELWFQQIFFSNNLKFLDECIIICSLTLPVSHTSVIEGLIIKSKLPLWYNQILECKSLIIKGSIVFGHIHLGYCSSVEVTSKLNSNEVTFTEKDVWIKNCLAILIKLKVNLILTHGAVDSTISDFCSLNSILILSNIPLKEITALCHATKTSPCTYLLDCDYKDVKSSLRIKEWNPGHSTNDYIHVVVTPSAEVVKLSTVILCHPNPVLLKCQEHQLCHIISRLKLATSMNKILPGGGKTEEHIFRKMESFSFNNDLKAKVSAAIANGFKRYADAISDKLEIMNAQSREDALDESHSKIEAWLCAITLVYLTIQCDSIITPDHSKEHQCNLIGIL